MEGSTKAYIINHQGGLRMLKLTVELPNINHRHLHRNFPRHNNKTGVSLSERQAFNHAQVLSTESLK